MAHWFVLIVVILVAACLASEARSDATPIDLTTARVVTPADLSPRAERAVSMLVEEVARRTRITWAVTHQLPTEDVPTVVVGDVARLRAAFPGLTDRLGGIGGAREGYRLDAGAAGDRPTVIVAGHDERGVLFGVGRLLRTLRMARDHVGVPGEMRIDSAPKVALRGHQLGYRPKTNSYDGWSVPMWKQYIRDLAVFGTNAVELIPPRSDDDADSPHFPLPPMQMMIEMSRLLNSYGLDVWVWYPAMDKDYTDAKTVETALHEWEDVFRQLPRIDAVFVPGGDPGHTQPRVLMAFLEKATAALRRHHRHATMWVSPQGFTADWMEEFLSILSGEHPAWLTGVVFGPQVRMPLDTLRKRVPARYGIRLYPDITHCLKCQYPPHDWDTAYALTEAREPINPRPIDQAHILRTTVPNTVGFLTYSEGCNDDVNKMVWSALGWDPDADMHAVLREYARYFIGDPPSEGFAQGLLALERNWRGPLVANPAVETTLQQFQQMERDATPQMRQNWRFQQALYRAYYDAFVYRRLRYENELETRAIDALGRAERIGTEMAIREAERILELAVTQPVGQELRARVFELGEALFQSIHMQLSVPRYQAIATERGANLDGINTPLNNRTWLSARFAEIRALPDEAARRKAIAEIGHWTDPGPGGFYDEPGDPLRRPHLLPGAGFEADPSTFASVRNGFGAIPTGRIQWSRHAETLYDAPLRMRYIGLVHTGHYHIRVVYSGDQADRPIRLVAGDTYEVHPLMLKPWPVKPLEFAIPAGAITPSGELLLTWNGAPGRGSNGRGCQVSEVWLIRDTSH